MKENNIPILRFSEFNGDWEKRKVRELLQRYSQPVTIEKESLYQQIGVRSHGKGIFYKDHVTGRTLGNKRVFWVKENALIINIVFAWEQAVAITTESERGMIASHRFPMYLAVEGRADLNFLLKLFLTRKGKTLLELASPGGAGRNKTLGQHEFDKLNISVPSLDEQRRIASLFATVDNKVKQLIQKKAFLEQYMKGVMQQLFSRQLRFRNEKGTDFPDWEYKKARDVFRSISNKNHNGDLPILAITQEQGAVSRDSLDIRIISSDKSIRSYKIVEKGDFIISLRSFQGGIEYSGVEGICSPAYTILKSSIPICDSFFKYYFKKDSFIEELSNVVVGIRDGKQISYEAFANLTIPYPSVEEQIKIANFISAIDLKIAHTQKQIDKTEQWKKGLLQKMFI